jgi:formylmethanofuran dehydrogenase subunit E
MSTEVAPYVEALGQLHRVLCPRQVLGVRAALLAGRTLGLPFPQADKRAIAVVEIDGCFADGVMVVSGCSVGHGTLRVLDYGKIAATIVDTYAQRAVRIWPRPGIRLTACAHAPSASSRWHAQRDGYARMPDAELLSVEYVAVRGALARLAERHDGRAICARCGEEVFNRRQVLVEGEELCRACAATGDGEQDAG